MPRRGMQQRWLVVRGAVITFVLFTVVILECRWCTQLTGTVNVKLYESFLVVLVCMESSFAVKVEYERCPSKAFRR